MAVRLEQRGEFAIMWLDRPEALNALSFAVLDEIAAAFDKAASWLIRGLIVTGAGDKAFCAGADVKELAGREVLAERRGIELGQRTFAKLDDYPVPSIAVINGYAFGGGLELALACTFRLAAPNALMALPEIKLGLIPGYGGTQRLARLIGAGRALELILTGRQVAAEEAERIGLVNRVMDGDPLEGALAFARGFSSYSLPVLAFARAAVVRGLDVSLAEGLRIEADLAALAYRTSDAAEGLTAFVAKRKPDFRDA